MYSKYGHYLFIVVILCILLWVGITRTERVEFDGRQYNVVGRYSNKKRAAEVFSKLHGRMVKLSTHLKSKYLVYGPISADFVASPGTTGSSVSDLDVMEAAPGAPVDLVKITQAIIHNYNPDVLYENDPATSRDTAYTLNKGDSMYFCIRNKELNEEFCDFNILLFAMLHEVSHIGTYDGWGHGVRFWEVFKFVLREAVACGAYEPVDYSKNPKEYCGMKVEYNPLFDKTLRDI